MTTSLSSAFVLDLYSPRLILVPPCSDTPSLPMSLLDPDMSTSAACRSSIVPFFCLVDSCPKNILLVIMRPGSAFGHSKICVSRLIYVIFNVPIDLSSDIVLVLSADRGSVATYLEASIVNHVKLGCALPSVFRSARSLSCRFNVMLCQFSRHSVSL